MRKKRDSPENTSQSPNEKAPRKPGFLRSTYRLLFYILRDTIQLKIYPSIKNLFQKIQSRSQGYYKGVKHDPSHEWMNPVAGAHMSTVTFSYRLIFYIIFTFFILFIIWANFFYIDEYVRAQGAVEPESELKMISHYEGGIVEDIYVKDGQSVKKGDPLIKIKDTSSEATYQESMKTYFDSLAQKERLLAQIHQKPLVLSPEIGTYSSLIVQQTMERYQSRMNSLKNDKEIIQDQIKQHENELEQAKEKIKALKVVAEISLEKAELLKGLLDKKLIARTQYLQAKLEYENRHMEMTTTKNALPELKAKISEARNKLDQVDLSYNQKDWQELKEHELKFLAAEKVVATGKDREERSIVRSPVDGIVKELMVKTKGSAILSGRDLLSIVPSHDKLIVEALVIPQDIGFIKIGDESEVKLMPFDYSIYGVLRGKVIHISADSIQDPKDPKVNYYKVKVRTNQQYLTHNGIKHWMSPGMTAQVNIVTAKRKVIYYLLKPIAKTLEDPLRER